MLVGRQAERGRIDALLGRARTGHGGALVVRGEPGIGKSALLEYARHQAAGMRVLHARGVESEADLPFSGLIELLRPLASSIDLLAEGQADALRGVFALGPRLEGKLLIGLAAVSLLSAAAEERPIVCVVDDAHWLDVASTEAFVFVARRLEDDAVAFLFGTRNDESRRFAVPGADELELGGLSEPEARDLVVQAGQQLGAGVLEQLYAGVRGNPLALLELPSALSERQQMGAEPLVDPLPVTEALQQAFARRIERLPEETRQALVVAAAEPSGRTPPVERALAALALDPEMLEAAEDEGLVSLGAGQIVFRHPLVRAAAYHRTRPSERRRMHRALAEASAELNDPHARAWHLAAAASGTDEEAAAALETVAEQAKAQGTLVAAAAAFERAAALSAEPEQHARRLCRAARAYARIRGARAFAAGGVVVAQALPRTCDPSLRTELEYWEAFFEIDRDPARAHDLLLARAAELADHDPAFAALLAAEAAHVALCYLDLADVGAASAAARTYSRRAPGPVDPYVVAVRAVSMIACGRLVAAAQLGPAVDAIIGQLHDVVTARGDYAENLLPIYRWPTMYSAARLIAEPQQRRALMAALAGGRAAWASAGDGAALMIVPRETARVDYDAGRWDDARAGLAVAEGISRELGENRSLWWVVADIAQLAAARGLEGECRAYRAELNTVGDGGRSYRLGFFSGYPGTGALGLLALGRREYEEAVEEYERALLPRLGPLVLSHELADAIEAYLRAGRETDAERSLALFAAQARASGWAWAQARAAHLDLLFADDHRIDEAFGIAAGFHEHAEQPFLRARTELAYGERLRRAGLRRQAREHLRAALEVFERLAAVPWADHAESELRATGERLRRRTDPNASQLTPQELQVALLVARGASNKEAAAQLYLSPKTIEKHLGSTYTKLGLRSRTELARVFAAEPAAAAGVAG